jgi:hypothetical protein
MSGTSLSGHRRRDVVGEVPVDAQVDGERADAADAQAGGDGEALQSCRRERVERADGQRGGDGDGLLRALRERHRQRQRGAGDDYGFCSGF